MRMLARRILFYAITALAAVTVDFMIPRVMPGNPVEALLSHMQGQVTVQNIHALEAQYGLNSSAGLWGQYTHYLANVAHGNLGLSTSSYPATVTSVIRGALPWTIGLIGMATVISFVLGTLLGVLVAWRRGSGLDRRHAERDGHHDGRGLRADGAGQGPAEGPGDLVRGAERHPAQRLRFLAGDRLCGLRRAADRDRVQLPRARLHPAAGGGRARLPAATRHLPDHHVRRACREPGSGLCLPVPRSANPAGGLSDGRRHRRGRTRPRPPRHWPPRGRHSRRGHPRRRPGRLPRHPG